MTERRTFHAVDDLIRSVEAIATETPRLVADARAAIKAAIAGGADPYLLADVLADGIAACIVGNVPRELEAGAAMSALRLSNGCLLELGII